MAELKFVITGTAGVGKTTALTSLCDIPPISTDAATTDELSSVKSTTTVAFDFGEIILDDDTHIRIYGTPGQSRFKHMWDIIAEEALGLIVLVDHSRPDPIEDLKIYLDNFAGLVEKTGVVIGVTRLDADKEDELDIYYQCLEEKNIFCPIMIVDPRQRSDMVDLMDALMAYLEYA